MFGPAWIFAALKIVAVLGLGGYLVHKGMMIERAKVEKALAAKNAEITQQLETERTLRAKAEEEREQAFREASDALLRMDSGACVLPEELIKKANGIR